MGVAASWYSCFCNFSNLKGHFSRVKNGSKVFYGSSAKNGCGRGCHMAWPYGFAIFKILVEEWKSEIFKKKWDIFQIPNIVLVTHDDLLKISIWPRVEKLVPSTPRGSRYDFYAQLDQNLWPSWWKSWKNVKLCQNGLQKNVFWLLRSSLGSVFDFKSI